MQASRSAFNAERAASPSPRELDDAELTEAIVAAHDESNGAYGVPRVHAELASRGRPHPRAVRAYAAARASNSGSAHSGRLTSPIGYCW
ncbi:transposase [Micromonospora sp. CPCC 205739]|uniref:transposase n=1 Tax=unclassified Micromonospora TaxID=2617518 RepID=UPI003FA6050F